MRAEIQNMLRGMRKSHGFERVEVARDLTGVKKYCDSPPGSNDGASDGLVAAGVGIPIGPCILFYDCARSVQAALGFGR